MLYTIFDPDRVANIGLGGDEHEAYREATHHELIFTELSAESATINLLLSNERSRTTILKMYDKDTDRFEVKGPMSTVIDSSVAHSLPTQRSDAHKIGSVIYYLEQTEDKGILDRILRAYPTIKRLQQAAALERGELDLHDEESLDEYHRQNLNESMDSAALIDALELTAVIRKEIPGFQKSDESELMLPLVNYLGFLCFLDEKLDALSGVVLTCSDGFLDQLKWFTRSVYEPVLKDFMREEMPEYYDKFFPGFQNSVPPEERTFATPDNVMFSMLLDNKGDSDAASVFLTGLEATLKSMQSIAFPQLGIERLSKKLQDEVQDLVDTTLDDVDLPLPTQDAIDYSLYRTAVAIKLLDQQLLYADKMAVAESNRRDRLARQKEEAASVKLQSVQKQREQDEAKYALLSHKFEKVNDALAKMDRLKMDLADANEEISYLKEIALVTKDQDDTVKAVQNIDLDSIIKRFNKKGCVFVGGDINWIQKMQTILSEAKFVDTDHLGRSKKTFENADIIVLNVGTMNHSMYGQVKKSIADDAELYYINSQQSNEGKTLRYLAVAKNKN